MDSYYKKKFDIIFEYLESYSNKLKDLNAIGLTDESKFFENFASDICEIYFNQKFVNLNLIKSNFEYVDLESKNNEIFVQVSTTKSTVSKVNR